VRTCHRNTHNAREVEARMLVLRAEYDKAAGRPDRRAGLGDKASSGA